jgi:tight adherence protein C
MTPIVFFILAAATLSLLIWSGAQLFRSREDPLADRLEELRSSAMMAASRPPRRAEEGGLGGFLYFVSLLPGGEGWIRDTEKRLNQAGARKRSGVALYLVFNALFMAFMLGGMFWIQRDNDFLQMFGGMTAAFILGFTLPGQVLHRLVKRYRRKLQEALPDTVDLLGIVLGAGLALDQAMAKVSDEMQYVYPELAAEFSTVVMQVRAGQERTVAFQQLVRRTGVEDIKSLVAMIVQSEKFGASLGNALKVYADALRTRRRLRAEAALGRAGVKMVFPILIFILPVLFIVTLVPGVLSVLRDLAIMGAGR